MKQSDLGKSLDPNIQSTFIYIRVSNLSEIEFRANLQLVDE
jgi:hypothetical protein